MGAFLPHSHSRAQSRVESPAGQRTTATDAPCCAAVSDDAIAKRASSLQFCANWAKSNPGSPPDKEKQNSTIVTPDALESYFNRNTTGPGIWKWRHYFSAYQRHLDRFVGTSLIMAEVGVYSGGSLAMWHAYFGEGLELHGIDIEDSCRIYQNARTKIHIGDQEDRAFWQRFREEVPNLDVFVDDGGHTPAQQMVTLEEVLPYMRPGGVYICEDIHGVGNEFYLFLAGLVNHLNHYEFTHEAVNASYVSPLQRYCHSIHFYPYLVVIEKNALPIDTLVAPKNGTEWQPFFDKTV